MNKKAELPFWLTMVIYIMLGVVIILLIIGATQGKINEIFDTFGEWF